MYPWHKIHGGLNSVPFIRGAAASSAQWQAAVAIRQLTKFANTHISLHHFPVYGVECFLQLPPRWCRDYPFGTALNVDLFLFASQGRAKRVRWGQRGARWIRGTLCFGNTENCNAHSIGIRPRRIPNSSRSNISCSFASLNSYLKWQPMPGCLHLLQWDVSYLYRCFEPGLPSPSCLRHIYQSEFLPPALSVLHQMHLGYCEVWWTAKLEL